MAKWCTVAVNAMVLINSLSYLLCVKEDSDGYFHKSDETILQQSIIKKIEGISKFQCLHRCRIKKECEDIAIQDGSTCLLLRKVPEEVQEEVDGNEIITKESVQRFTPHVDEG